LSDGVIVNSLLFYVLQNNWANFTQTSHKAVKKFVQMKNHVIQERDILKNKKEGGGSFEKSSQKP
jgi:hypothetical protein